MAIGNRKEGGLWDHLLVANRDYHWEEETLLTLLPNTTAKLEIKNNSTARNHVNETKFRVFKETTYEWEAAPPVSTTSVISNAPSANPIFFPIESPVRRKGKPVN